MEIPFRSGTIDGGRSIGTIIYALMCLIPSGMGMGGHSESALLFDLVNIAFLIAGVGLLLLKNWARKFYIIAITALIILFTSLLIFGSNKITLHILSKALIYLAWGLPIPIIIIWYLSRPKIKERFKP